MVTPGVCDTNYNPPDLVLHSVLCLPQSLLVYPIFVSLSIMILQETIIKAFPEVRVHKTHLSPLERDIVVTLMEMATRLVKHDVLFTNPC